MFRVICDRCGCGTPWCSTPERAWRLWNNRSYVQQGKAVVARIVRYDGLDFIDSMPFSDLDKYYEAKESLNRDGWCSIGCIQREEVGISFMVRRGSI